ncbi:3'(2'),5'-bisphosphate nucleotidase CysQ [Acuticoccus sp.]|uniref:3'(2'),5'-bisphosphate nucleotidase CysQ n=1 Tax=Acuticoccus sp. TaxID=1904378 RepID=UPI003B52C95C
MSALDWVLSVVGLAGFVAFVGIIGSFVPETDLLIVIGVTVAMLAYDFWVRPLVGGRREPEPSTPRVAGTAPGAVPANATHRTSAPRDTASGSRAARQASPFGDGGPSARDVVAVALTAGEAILRHYDPRGQEARAKADGSPVTAADEAAEAIILDGLRKLGVTRIVAEEAFATGGDGGIDPADEFWLIDPLDGTKEFVSGSGEFTVNIARIVGGRPSGGVVLCPALGELYWTEGNGAHHARVEGGAIVGERRIEVRTPQGPLRVVASKSHLTEETRTFVERFDVHDFLSFGSSLKFCRVADGTADLYPRMGRTMEWDTAAGHAVLAAAGGEVRTMDGARLTYGKVDHPSGAYANPHFVAAGAFDPFALAKAS